MMGWADTFSEGDLWDVTYYIRSFSNENVKLPLIAAGLTGTTDSNDTGGQHADQVISEVRDLVDQSFAMFKEQKIKEAAETAFDAYLIYEKIESGLINKNKKLGLKLESAFSRYRGEIKRGAPASQVEHLRDGIQADLSKALETLKVQMGFTGLFIQSFTIILREGFEAILIIAALIAFLIKSNNRDKLKSIYSGVFFGVLGSFLTAYLIHEVLNISLASQELMEGIIMLVTVAVLFSVSYWLVSKISTEKWQQYITGKMKQAVSTGSLFTLGAVAFLSVYREGFETVLFYKALYTYAGGSTAGILPGFILGSLSLGVIYYLVNQVGVRVPIKWFFVFTSAFLYYMAFTFMGKGLHELQMAEALGLTPISGFPQISFIRRGRPSLDKASWC
ncbi:MAG: FTR1 family protein [Nitrospinales bacterium]